MTVSEHTPYAPSARRWFKTSTNDNAAAVAYDHVIPGFSPYRTSLGVVIAAALAPAATRSRSRFGGINIMMLLPPEEDPEQVIEPARPRARLRPACERYLRQFAHLDGWPPS